MRITKALAALVLAFSLTGYCVSGYIPENSRQGSDPVFADSAPGPTPSVSAFTAGFVAWDTTNRIGHRIWGNFRWPDKPGHGVKPCKDEELGDLLDRLDFGRSFGGPGHDPHHYGRHFAATISPYLYASRRFDTFSQTYNNRNRYYNPRVGRFLTKDPIGFAGDWNLFRYANNNPVRYSDRWGLTVQDLIDEMTIWHPTIACTLQDLWLANAYEDVYLKAKWIGVQYGRHLEDMIYDDDVLIRGLVPSWRLPFTLEDHWVRHGRPQFGSDDPVIYGRRANDFFQRGQMGQLRKHVTTAGNIIYGDPTTSTVGFYNADGTTRTMFKPDDPFEEYWQDKVLNE